MSCKPNELLARTCIRDLSVSLNRCEQEAYLEVWMSSFFKMSESSSFSFANLLEGIYNGCYIASGTLTETGVGYLGANYAILI